MHMDVLFDCYCDSSLLSVSLCFLKLSETSGRCLLVICRGELMKVQSLNSSRAARLCEFQSETTEKLKGKYFYLRLHI